MISAAPTDAISLELARWIYTRLKYQGQIRHEEAIHATEFDDQTRSMLIRALSGLEKDRILFTEKSYNEKTKNVEIVYYSRKAVL